MKKILILCFLALAPFIVRAAEFSSVVNSGKNVEARTAFSVELLLEPKGTVNGIQGTVILPVGLSVADIRFDRSIIPLWVESPHAIRSGDHEEIVFSGLVPGGFSGLLSPYYHGSRPGTLFTIRATALNEGVYEILFKGMTYLQDGQGTESSVPPLTASITVGPHRGGEAEKRIDTTVPEAFLPVVSKSPLIFNDRWFVSFDTKDTESGINYYEVAEVQPGSFGEPLWKRAASPYELKDQTLESVVYVRAVDHDGNMITEEVRPQNKGTKAHPWIISGILLLAILLFISRRKLYEK
ncbi:MAG: hypothetical protein JWN89_95 [Parcubacteria group bacterium]|nr:hypothetical protein [Parcubacteria group bacterium]